MSSYQKEQKDQQPQSQSEIDQSMLAELETTKQSITNLSNEQLDEVAGGLFSGTRGVYD